MKMTGFSLLLLLLLCSGSTGQTEMEKQSSVSQPCVQDIDAAVRQLTALLAQQQVEITSLQRQSQGTVLNHVVRKIETGNLVCMFVIIEVKRRYTFKYETLL